MPKKYSTDSEFQPTYNPIDPIRFVKMCWPHYRLYDKQREIMYSVRDNDETVVPAGNMLGKDFISAVVALWFFCTRAPCKVVTTSVKYDQLDDVLWGEIRRLIRDAKCNLPIQYNHMNITRLMDDGTVEPQSEITGQAVSKGEAIQGRHIPSGPQKHNGIIVPRTLCIFDEASGIDDEVYNLVRTWAKRILVIGNPLPTVNFFYQAVKEGDVVAV